MVGTGCGQQRQRRRAGSGLAEAGHGPGGLRGPALQVGLAASFNPSDAGDRSAYSVFGGIRTGPVAWLGNWRSSKTMAFRRAVETSPPHCSSRLAVAKGHNLKLTSEWFEPDRDVDEDEQTRFSVVYEYPHPVPAAAAAARFYDGIPQNDLQNRRAYFVELHAYF